ncbi:hypothetical protein KP509_29G035100 [Ceratopteris richardii]|uniref:Uncharacterized protein n=1 Tax=Ceratopteris richardii TaxID=49495 RepID=A0A8T2R875_CERRI|nr:hypothetical protein KP509_29G035100 [Ceratopteris richardii]
MMCKTFSQIASLHVCVSLLIESQLSSKLSSIFVTDLLLARVNSTSSFQNLHLSPPCTYTSSWIGLLQININGIYNAFQKDEEEENGSS